MDETLKRATATATRRAREIERYLRLLRGAKAYPEVLRELGLEERLDAQGDVVLGRPRDDERIPVVLAECPLEELWSLAQLALPCEPRAAARAAWSARVEHMRERLRDSEQRCLTLAGAVRFRQAELAGAVAGLEYERDTSIEHATTELRRRELELDVERGHAADMERRYADAVAEATAWRTGRGSVLRPRDMCRGELLMLLRRSRAGERELALVVWALRAERAAHRGDTDARDVALAQVVAWGGDPESVDTHVSKGTQ